MVLAAHHPSYLPPIIFFHKMCRADVLVLTDDFQFTTSGQINRARIKTAVGPQWLTVPVLTKGRPGQKISEVEINQQQPWQRKHWKTLCVNYTFAAYFEQFADQLGATYSKNWEYLLDLNLTLIDFIQHSLNISTRIVLSSSLNLSGEGVSKLIDMTEILECDTFLAEMAYRNYLPAERFARYGKELKFFEYETPGYHQQFGEFIPGLSIIDLLLNEGKAVRDFLSKAKVEK